MVLLIDGMVFTPRLTPCGVVGEVGIGTLWGVGYLGETETVGKGQGLLVDGGASDDVDVLVGRTVGEGFIERGIDITAGQLTLGARDDDIPTIGQGSLGERVEGLSAHNDGMTRGERLETLQVVGQPIE